jgi:MoxR-like ATPase
VLATQNPIEQEGTYPLPEAQVDRFMLKVKVDYPDREEEREIIRRNINDEDFGTVRPVIHPKDILRAREQVRQVYMDEKIERYILDIVIATREPQKAGLGRLRPLIQYGASPRAGINLALAAKALAFLRRRGYVIPEDILYMCPDVLRHRIGLSYEAEAENITPEDIIKEVLNVVAAP